MGMVEFPYLERLCPHEDQWSIPCVLALVMSFLEFNIKVDLTFVLALGLTTANKKR